ncbi:glutathione S-transferase family protein [Variovorax sp. J2P1-59]|uniref:glutathione S-transferase family protein n=1 Tax=Variovorax flavidus TaxID=3053501 RepID=UPI00257740AE|nr:glutathione S-transferase family protein [Variovorax sp. J2P1-59]MDM0077258.1 glutathione S-transferase family protein [Variovorax sp. J2P1-59]
MLILRTSTASPFGRKVRMAIGTLGLTSQVEVVNADTSDPHDSLRQQNPLGKIPTLILEDGEALFDSRVIVEHLNAMDGRDILIPAGVERIGVLREQALADGLMDAAILQMYEIRFRPPTHHVESWLAHQRGKVERALDFAATRLPVRRPAGPHIGEITLAAALGYLDFRFHGKWRATHPALESWLDEFAGRVPAFAETAP